MAKIGILTFHFAHNYGAMLQAYALRKFLSDCGYECEVINYIPEKMGRAYSTSLLGPDNSVSLRRMFSIYKRRKQVSLFKFFLEEYLKVKDSDVDYSKYDVIVVGSDQVWNLDLTYNDKVYFLAEVVNGSVGVGYAISIGKKVDDKLADMIVKYIGKFRHLSFREKSACDQISKLIGRECENVADPVFLLSKDMWMQIESKPKSIKENQFILFYALDSNDELLHAVSSLREKYNLPVVFIHPLCVSVDFECIKLNDVGPCEFLWLIHHSTYIVTNSFHAMAFSGIYGKKSIIAHNGELGERTKHLYTLLNLVTDSDGIIDFNIANQKRLENHIINSKWFILHSIDDVINKPNQEMGMIIK